MREERWYRTPVPKALETYTNNRLRAASVSATTAGWTSLRSTLIRIELLPYLRQSTHNTDAIVSPNLRFDDRRRTEEAHALLAEHLQDGHILDLGHHIRHHLLTDEPGIERAPQCRVLCRQQEGAPSSDRGNDAGVPLQARRWQTRSHRTHRAGG